MNQLPTTERQLELYKELHKNNVQYCLIGCLAAIFYGRWRMTTNIDLLVKYTEDNIDKVKESLLTIGYPADEFNFEWLGKARALRVGGPSLVDVHIDCSGIKYEDVSFEINWYEGVPINVVSKKDLMRIYDKAPYGKEELRILKLLEDPENNSFEISISQ